MTIKQIKLSEEVFSSLQGEGLYTGRSSIWVRFWGCNLQCDGFGQKDPTDRYTYVLPYKELDVSSFKSVTDLPVFKTGCDSSYSWSSNYKFLIPEKSAQVVCDDIEKLLNGTSGRFNVLMNGRFEVNRHLCFTGGESLLKRNQSQIILILAELETRGNLPLNITFETNGTQALTNDFKLMVDYYRMEYNIEFHASCSPKLHSVSGELHSKAWNHGVVSVYHELFDRISFKFVVGNDDNTWNEIDEYLSYLKFHSKNVYIMPVGATQESQSTNNIALLVDKALAKGYHISSRVHTYVFGNKIGT